MMWAATEGNGGMGLLVRLMTFLQLVIILAGAGMAAAGESAEYGVAHARVTHVFSETKISRSVQFYHVGVEFWTEGHQRIEAEIEGQFSSFRSLRATSRVAVLYKKSDPKNAKFRDQITKGREMQFLSGAAKRFAFGRQTAILEGVVLSLQRGAPEEKYCQKGRYFRVHIKLKPNARGTSEVILPVFMKRDSLRLGQIVRLEQEGERTRIYRLLSEDAIHPPVPVLVDYVKEVEPNIFIGPARVIKLISSQAIGTYPAVSTKYVALVAYEEEAGRKHEAVLKVELRATSLFEGKWLWVRFENGAPDKISYHHASAPRFLVAGCDL